MKQLHIIVVVVGALLSSSCTTQPVSYRNDVVPIIESRCSKCHTPPDGVGYTATGLSICLLYTSDAADDSALV